MSAVCDLIASGLVGQLVAGIAVNLQMAALAQGFGLVLGVALCLLQKHRYARVLVADPVVALMRAAPTFVVMFVLLHAVPADARLFGMSVAPSPMLAVAVSLTPFAAAYVVDNGKEAIVRMRAGQIDAALLFLPNLTRSFFVLVMSSSAGAAIGAGEGVSVIFGAAQSLQHIGDKLLLFGLGIAAFGVVLQTGLALARAVQRRISERFAAKQRRAGTQA